MQPTSTLLTHRFRRSCIVMLTAALMAALSACSNRDADLQKMVPADAVAVATIDLPTVLRLSGIDPESNDLPGALKTIVKENDRSPLCQALSRLPRLGINFDGKIYAYMPARGPLGLVILVSLNDMEKTKTSLERIVGGDFAVADDVATLTRAGNIFALTDNVLLIAQATAGTPDNEAIAEVRRALQVERDESSGGDSPLNAVLSSERQFAAAMTGDALRRTLAQHDQYAALMTRFPVIQLFTESDIDCWTMNGTCTPDSILIDLECQAKPGSDYATLMSEVLASPDANVLRAIPASMDYIGMMSLKGAAALRLPQVEKLVEQFGEIQYVGRMDIKPLISTIDGPVAVGAAADPHLPGVWNLVLSARSRSPQQVLDYITDFGSRYGQHPQVWDGELIYQWDNKMVRIAAIGNIVYVKLLDYEQTEGAASDIALLHDAFGAAVVGGYARSHVGNDGSVASWIWQMTDANHGKVLFTPAAAGQAPLELLELLSAIKPDHEF